VTSSGRRQPVALARRLVAGLGLTLVIGLLPASVAAASPKAGAGLLPTIHYEEAQAHANDHLVFAAGGRVSVPFRPRASDVWTVAGGAPRTLPAGRRSGLEMRQTDQPRQVVPGTTVDDTIDRPSVDPTGSIEVTDAVFDPASDAATITPAAKVSSGGLKREVFGFLPYWELTDTDTRLDWDKVSTVAYFGVGADGSGNLQKTNTDGSTTVGWSGWTSAKLTSVMNAAHASGARVVLTVQSFAWSTSGAARQQALLGSATARSRLATQIVSAVRDRGADGVNLDFEPLSSGYEAEFTSLVRKIRASLNAAAPGYQLTFDTTGWIGNYPIEDATASGGADAIMVMGYDYRNAGAGVAGSIAPIDSSIYDLRDTLAAYTARVSPSKLILGVPYYGRAWSTLSTTLHAKNVSGTKYGSSATANYDTAYDFGVQYGRQYDAAEGVAWTAYPRQTCTSTYGCVDAYRQLYWDDATALKTKYDLVNQRGLRGVGIWALGYDGTRPELYQALADRFIKDDAAPAIKTATITSNVLSPNGDDRFETTTASLSATGLIRFGWSVKNGSGTEVRSGSKTGTAPSWTWNGKNASGTLVTDGTYALTMWVADANDNRSSATFSVRVDTKSPKVVTTTGHGFLSPDGNGQTDTIGLAWTATSLFHGTVRIFDGSMTSRKLWTFKDLTSWSTSWNGKDDHGVVLPDGRYTYRVNGRDLAGNLRITDKTILIDRTIKSHRWSDYSFDPRAGQTSTMTVSLLRSATVSATIYKGSSTTAFRKIWVGKAEAAGSHTWKWTGKSSSGTYASAGTYHIVVLAKSKYGTTRWTRTVTIQAH
jgi:spore germination protein YaaH/flagellar hook assembly protein FlgD